MDKKFKDANGNFIAAYGAKYSELLAVQTQAYAYLNGRRRHL